MIHQTRQIFISNGLVQPVMGTSEFIQKKREGTKKQQKQKKGYDLSHIQIGKTRKKHKGNIRNKKDDKILKFEGKLTYIWFGGFNQTRAFGYILNNSKNLFKLV
jgi:hypothetical protein